MKAHDLLIALFCLAVAGSANAQVSKSKQQKKQEDLPDVALQIPADTRPEVKAIIKDNAIALASRKSSERIKAAHVLGELGVQGKPVRGLLCRAMLDSYQTVRVAAADALKSIVPKIQYLAVALVTEKDSSRRHELLTNIQDLKEDGEPLAPLVANSAKITASHAVIDTNGRTLPRDENALSQEITTLSYIAKNDMASYKLIASALDNGSEHVRLSAVQSVARMKHGPLAIKKLITLIKTDTTKNRIAAIHTLSVIADKSTEEMVTAAIAGQRYHAEESIRKAVEEALNKLENK